MKVYGEAAIAKFAKKHAVSRKPLQRFLEIVKQTNWLHFADVKSTFGSADYVAGQLVFDIGGNKYRPHRQRGLRRADVRGGSSHDSRGI